MTDDLVWVRESVAADMEDIQRRFKPGAKIAVLVRSPGFPDHDFIMTDDRFDELILMLQRGKDRAAALAGKQAPSGELSTIEGIIARIVRDVSEWSDRTSPPDYPNHLLLTPDELERQLRLAIGLAGRIQS